ncbi:hypothetical protein V8E53_015730 [Lactarius tabidus]
MASGAIYPSAAHWDYPTGYPHDDHPEYTPYPSARSLQQYPHPHQVWTPPSRLSYDSYQDSPYMHPSPVPSMHASPPSLRHSLVDDPAFAPDPNNNPDNWFVQRDMLSPTHFPVRSHSGSDLPPGFVPQPGPVPNPSGRSHSHHENIRESSSAPQFYFIPPSARSSSSTSDSSASGSSALRIPSAPRSRARSSDQVYDFPESSFRSPSVTDVPVTITDEARPRNAKPRPKRRSAHAAEPASDHPEVPGIVVSSVEHIAGHEDQTFRNFTSSSAPPSTAPSERPTEGGRTRTSSRVNPADLDSIDELDETNPYGFNLHHKGPYEAVAAILDETNPVDSPLLRMKGIQQQVSVGSPLRPSRKIKSEPNANPMALNLKPGQILQSSIYQPMRAPHYPIENATPTYPYEQYIHTSHTPTEVSRVDYDAASVGSPLRRNQTLPVTSSARAPLEQSHHIPHPVRSEDQTYKRPYPVDPSIYPPPLSGSQNSAPQPQMPRYTSEAPLNPMPLQSSQRAGSDPAVRRRSSYIDPVHNVQPFSQAASSAPAFHPGAPPSPDLDRHFSRTLYLTNPDHTQDAPNHRSRGLPSAPEVIYPSPEPRSERSSRGRAHSSYGDQGQPPRAPASTEPSRRSSPRSSPPSASSTPPHQEKPRRYEPPSQTMATLRVPVPGHTASVTSGSSSRTSSSLAPRHVPKRLVMPTPLAATAENPRRPPPSSRANSGGDPRRPPQLLRRRSVPGALPPPRRPSKPPQAVSRGVLSFFGFGKGSKPTVHEVRVTEPPKLVMSEKHQQLRVRAPQEPRKLSKRK